ncbi:Transmembrane protein 130 [Liparis tanakae]|uniref:Transmembrane protein 130 n=1 Tax=Liparis tanakae TaxID=230148 RepID=A0A4Z2G6P0_9TELE|nr:Transmembrane protein 130 [Liparis tanakae]
MYQEAIGATSQKDAPHLHMKCSLSGASVTDSRIVAPSATGNVAGILLLLPLVGLSVTQTSRPFTDLENIAGKLVFYQMEGNATRVRATGELASDVPTETTFELVDPQKNFSTAKFTYTWDLGNGEVIHGTEPVVRYHYAESGNYTLRLKVGVKVTKYSLPITDVYSTDVQVLDAIKNIELKGPSDYKVSQNTGLAFQVDGSPPIWVCWRFLPDCVPDPAGSCSLTVLYENTLRLNHTFTSAGVHCLEISVRNDVSKMQTSFSLYVRRNGESLKVTLTTYKTQVIFILSCAAILVATFSFIGVVACRPRRRLRPQPLLTRLHGPLERSPPKHLHVGGQPGDHVPGDVGAAVGHGLDLHRLQNAVPKVHLTQLPHEGLAGVEAPAHHVLEGRSNSSV